jgi:hypothetical protein
MKRLAVFITFMIAILSTHAIAQTLSQEMQDAINICISLTEAIGADSNSQLKAANKKLKDADIKYFGNLRLQQGEETSLNGHFIFDEVFVDSLIVNRKVHKFAQKYATARSMRGATTDNEKVQMTNKALKKGAKAIWKTTSSRNITEFALIAEPNGLFTLNIKDKTGNSLYTETVNYKKGDAVRKAVITLPQQTKSTTLLIEITNCGKTDASFALLKR